jgi:hypothetical protein
MKTGAECPAPGFKGRFGSPPAQAGRGRAIAEEERLAARARDAEREGPVFAKGPLCSAPSLRQARIFSACRFATPCGRS